MQSVLQRLNAVVSGRWRQEFKSIEPPPGSKRLYMLCRLIVTLPISEGGPDVEAVYEDVGEMDGASWAGLKALYSDARKRAAVAAGVGAYLYAALERVVLPIGPNDRQVQLIRRTGKPACWRPRRAPSSGCATAISSGRAPRRSGAADSAPTSAAELAAGIPVPQRLPERYDGQPLRHLSPSSYSL